MLMSASDAASTMLTSSMSANFAITLILGFSLNNLWILINTLQVMVHLPLLAIQMPSNALYMLQALVSISNMDIISKK